MEGKTDLWILSTDIPISEWFDQRQVTPQHVTDSYLTKDRGVLELCQSLMHGNYSLLWYRHRNVVVQLPLQKTKRLSRLTVGYLCRLLREPMLQVHNCLKQSLPYEIKHFYCLLPFFLYFHRNLTFTFVPMGGKSTASNSDGTELINWLASSSRRLESEFCMMEQLPLESNLVC